MNAVAELHANIGPPLVRGPLALFPVYTSAVPAGRYRTGPAAARRKTVEIREADGGAAVPTLTVVNTDHRPLLLLDGETVLGNRQNRTLNVSVLVPAGATLAVPVSCVEQGRWGNTQTAKQAARHAPSRVRQAKLATVRPDGDREADQGLVWQTVAAYADDLEVPTATGALEDVHTAKAKDVDRLVAKTKPLDGQRGVIAAAHGRVLGLDLFDKPGTLSRYWTALTGAYALDALIDADDTGVAGELLAAEAEAFLRSALSAGESLRAVGLGEEVHLRGDNLNGHALVWDGAVIHLSAFANPGVRDDSGDAVTSSRRWFHTT